MSSPSGPGEEAVGAPTSEKAGTASTPGLVDEARALLQGILGLARIELAAGAKAKATGAGLLAATAVLGWLALKALLVAAGAALALVMPVWAAALVVAGVLLLVGAILVAVARPKLATPVSADAAREEAEETVRVLRERLGRS